jgi:hypothetical protein
MRNYEPAWVVLAVIVIVLIVACLPGCNDDSNRYCYKGHDEVIKDDAGATVFVCEEYRDTHFKYDNQQGASSNGVSK